MYIVSIRTPEGVYTGTSFFSIDGAVQEAKDSLAIDQEPCKKAREVSLLYQDEE